MPLEPAVADAFGAAVGALRAAASCGAARSTRGAALLAERRGRIAAFAAQAGPR